MFSSNVEKGKRQPLSESDENLINDINTSADNCNSVNSEEEEKQPLLSESKEDSQNRSNHTNPQPNDSVLVDNGDAKVRHGATARSRFMSYCCYFVCCGARNEKVNFNNMSPSSSQGPNPSSSQGANPSSIPRLGRSNSI